MSGTNFCSPFHRVAIAAGAVAALVPIMLSAAGCEGPNGGDGAGASSGNPRPMTVASVFSAPPHQGGAELWSANCTRCHNALSPSAFSPPEWDLIIGHMRTRANLTGEEARLVADFLKGGS